MLTLRLLSGSFSYIGTNVYDLICILEFQLINSKFIALSNNTVILNYNLATVGVKVIMDSFTSGIFFFIW